MEPQVIFEDDSFLVIDKPSGLVVNRAETTKQIETVQDWVETKITKIKDPATEIEKEYASRSGIVHRLDKDTSGLLIIAKTPAAFENLKNQFKNRETVKKYLALVHGKVEPGKGMINAPIERNPFNRKHFGIFPGGREARTDYQVKNYYNSPRRDEGDKLTLLELTPHTGRTHQIRVHLKYIHHPIISDPIYGGRKNVAHDRKWCPRLFLHAAFLQIKHPKSGEALKFESALPRDLQTTLSDLTIN